MKHFNRSMHEFNAGFLAPDTGAGTEGDAGVMGTEGDAGVAIDTGIPSKAPLFTGATVEKKDPINGQTLKIPTELEPYLGHIISSTRNAIEGQYKPLLEKLEGDNAELAEVRGELQKIKEASMTAEEKAQTNAKRKIAEHEIRMKNALTDTEMWKGRFQETTITNDIFSSFGDTVLCNPEQTAILLQREGKASVVEVLGTDGKPTGDFQTRLALNLVNEKSGDTELTEGTPKELFKRWVNQNDNLHHLVNNLNPGGQSNSNKKGAKGIDFMAMSAEERLNVARD